MPSIWLSTYLLVTASLSSIGSCKSLILPSTTLISPVAEILYAGAKIVNISINANILETRTLKCFSPFLEVISDGDIKGLNLEYEENKLILKNTELNLEKIFENYNELSSNYLFLKSFIKEYLESEETEILEDDENTIVVKITLLNSNKYIKYKELYIDRKTELPKKLIIKNSDKQIKVCIIYNNIEILQ